MLYVGRLDNGMDQSLDTELAAARSRLDPLHTRADGALSIRRNQSRPRPRRARESSLCELLFCLKFYGKRFVKNTETRALTGLDVKPPTTIAAYV